MTTAVLIPISLLVFSLVACQPGVQVASQGSDASTLGKSPEEYLTGNGIECVLQGKGLAHMMSALYGDQSDAPRPSAEEEAIVSGEKTGAAPCSEEVVNYLIEFLSSTTETPTDDVAVELPNIGSPAGSGMICGYATNSNKERFDFKLPTRGASASQIEAFKNHVTGIAMRKGGFVYFGCI